MGGLYSIEQKTPNRVYSSFPSILRPIMSKYKDTLNLPTTDFPMKASLPEREPVMLQHWQKIQLYERIQKNTEGRKRFILHDGPPYANGHIHIGHAVNKTLKDIVVKSKLLSGYASPYVPGWDCHGLPIELNVEKKIGKAGVSVKAEDFREQCRHYANSQIDIQREEFKRLGVLGDWDHPYTTMDYSAEATTIRALGKIIDNGHLTHGRKPVYWCVECGSALAEAEVEYQDKVSHAIDVGFAVLDTAAFLSRMELELDATPEIFVPIWTTTPWTLPANEAVALNAKHAYVLVEATVNQTVKHLLVAEELLASVMARYDSDHYRVLANALGDKFEHLLLQHPFLAREVPIVLGDHVTLDAGTGAVHTAPAHGQEDYIVGAHYHLPMHNPVDNRGCFHDNVPHFAGQHVFKANEHIIALLRQKGALLHEASLSHSYPHCWRHKTPLIYRATPQWFVSMDKNGLREKALAAIKKVAWIPGWGEARITDMIAKRPDWCISRQRVWGTPMPLFVHKTTNELHPDTLLLIEEVAHSVEQFGVEAWAKLDMDELLGAEAQHYEKVTDTLDVWFDSGVSHASELDARPELSRPANLYLEGSDQHRGWFQTSLLTSVAMVGEAPYREVLTHGFAVDAQGRKMSKSLGNVVAPEQVIKRLGADVLRLWVATTDYRGEMTVSDEILTRSSDAYRRLRNTARFLLSNLYDFNPEMLLSAEAMLTLDRWAVDCARRTQDEIIKDYDEYQFQLAVKKIHHFCSIDMGGFYLDILKDRLYTSHTSSIARRSAQSAMYHIVHALACWLAPILSFTAEEIWQHIPGDKNDSIFLTTWYEGLFSVPEAEQLPWQTIINAREAVNKELENCRNAGKIGSGLEAEVTLFCKGDMAAHLKNLGNELRFATITSSSTVADIKDKDGQAVPTDIENFWIKVQASSAKKCDRCWHRTADVGFEEKHPELCVRCVSNVEGKGEVRQFV
jgi:isoleucyl-tRNA synthetase